MPGKWLALLLVAAPLGARAQDNALPSPEQYLPPSQQTPPPQQLPPQTAEPPPVAPSALPESNGDQEPPKASSHYQSIARGHKPSPKWTQDRNFSTTRFWLLDPGQFAVETWADLRFNHDFSGVTNGAVGRPLGDWKFQQEIEIGIFPHVQLDIYENLLYNDDGSGKTRSVQQEGVQIEARVAIPSYYGQIFGNPVLYFEFHPRAGQPDRAEFKLLLGGAPTQRLFVALNPYIESNVEPTAESYIGTDDQGKPTVLTKQKWIFDAELGCTFAVGLKVTDWLRVSLQAKVGVDMLGDPTNTFHFVAWAGPGFILRPLPGKKAQYLKIVGTLLVDVSQQHWTDPSIAPQEFEPVLIIGSQF